MKISGTDAKRNIGQDGSRATNDDMDDVPPARSESAKGKEKYLREIADIEGLPDEEPVKEDSPEVKKNKSR